MCYTGHCPYENYWGECTCGGEYPEDAGCNTDRLEQLACESDRVDIDVEEIPDTDSREDLWNEFIDRIYSNPKNLLNEGEE